MKEIIKGAGKTLGKTVVGAFKTGVACGVAITMTGTKVVKKIAKSRTR